MELVGHASLAGARMRHRSDPERDGKPMYRPKRVYYLSWVESSCDSTGLSEVGKVVIRGCGTAYILRLAWCDPASPVVVSGSILDPGISALDRATGATRLGPTKLARLQVGKTKHFLS